MRSNLLSEISFDLTKRQIDDLWADQIRLEKDREEILLQKYLKLFHARLAKNPDQMVAAPINAAINAAQGLPEEYWTRFVLECAILECELTLEDINKSEYEQWHLNDEMVINRGMRTVEIDKFKKIKELLSNPENEIGRLEVAKHSKHIEFQRAVLSSSDLNLKASLASSYSKGSNWSHEIERAIADSDDRKIKSADTAWQAAIDEKPRREREIDEQEKEAISPLREMQHSIRTVIINNESKAKQELIHITNQFINPTKTNPHLTNKDEKIAIPRAIAELKKKEKDKALSLEDSAKLRTLRAAIEKAIRCEIEASSTSVLGFVPLAVSSKAATYAANLGEKEGYFLNFTMSPHLFELISSSTDMEMRSHHYNRMRGSVSSDSHWESFNSGILKEEQDSALIRKCEINLEAFRSNLGQRIEELGGDKEAEEKALMELKLRKSFVEELFVRSRFLRHGWSIDLMDGNLELRRITATQKYLTHYLKFHNVYVAEDADVVNAASSFGKTEPLEVIENVDPKVLESLKRQMEIADLEEEEFQETKKYKEREQKLLQVSRSTLGGLNQNYKASWESKYFKGTGSVELLKIRKKLTELSGDGMEPKENNIASKSQKAALKGVRVSRLVSREDFIEKAELEIASLRNNEGDELVIQHLEDNLARAKNSKPLQKRAEISEAREDARLINDTESKDWHLAQNKIARLENELSTLVLGELELQILREVATGVEMAQERLKLLSLERDELLIKSNLLKIQRQLLEVAESNEGQKEQLQMLEYLQKAKLQKFQKLQKLEIYAIDSVGLDGLALLDLENLVDVEEKVKQLQQRSDEFERRSDELERDSGEDIVLPNFQTTSSISS